MKSNEEIWRQVPSVTGILVSNEGRIMYLPHHKPMPNGGTRSYGGQPTFGVWQKDSNNKARGRFVLPAKNGRKTYKLARLIAEAFHGPPPFDGACVLHVDENAANNRVNNLRWGTQKENLNAPGFLAYCHNRVGENSPRVKGRQRKVACHMVCVP